MLNDYGFGGYLIWALPEQKVFIDGRADIYEWAGTFKEYGDWKSLAADPRQLLDKYHARLCILPVHEPMARMMPYLPGGAGSIPMTWRRCSRAEGRVYLPLADLIIASTSPRLS